MNKFISRVSIALFVFVLVSASAFSQDVFQSAFNRNLDAGDRETLASGKLLIKDIGKYGNVMLNPVSPEAKNLLEQLKKLNPGYLAEIVYIVPVSESEKCLNILYESLKNVEKYPEIPYHSQFHNDWSRLYIFLDVKASAYTESSAKISAYGEITPFNPYSFDIDLSRTASALEYRSQNTSEIKFKGVPCVGKGKMVTMVCAFPYGNSMIIYGIGGVNAPYVPVLNERIKTSFINRITTFCSYVFGKISQR